MTFTVRPTCVILEWLKESGLPASFSDVAVRFFYVLGFRAGLCYNVDMNKNEPPTPVMTIAGQDVRYVTQPGKFECRPIWTEWFFDRCHEGGADTSFQAGDGRVIADYVVLTEADRGDVDEALKLRSSEQQALLGCAGIRLDYYADGGVGIHHYTDRATLDQDMYGDRQQMEARS
jgi:hypothetical protein